MRDSNASNQLWKKVEALAPRLRETLVYVLRGLSKNEIADRMELSPHTIHGYLRTLYEEFGAKSRPRLMAMFIGDELENIAKAKSRKSNSRVERRSGD